MTKRSLSPDPASARRRIKPVSIEKRPFKIINLDEGDLVHQTCVAVHGECQEFDYAADTNFVSVSSSNMLSRAQTVNHWPLNKGQWKALLHHAVNYIPLLQLPPLHLAVLVAKDSPLLIDCPPAKYGGISTAHSTLNAAISKLRMSAYMWQALTAEDFRQKGLGRRSFRLEEEWSPNTTMQTEHQATPGTNSHMGTVAKVHIIRSDKTIAELRDADVAQQNPRGRDRDALHRYFEAALAKSGPPFESSCRPVVAGLILDAHYSTEQSMIMGHAALGCHKPDGISLGIFGSHLTYSWPRFLEEVPACLIDMMPTGDTVGNDNGECDTMRGACFVGQGAFLHEVGHALGAGHTTGIMARGYSKTWAMNFISHETNSAAENDAKWDLQDALKFKLLPHFALPGDELVSNDFRLAKVRVEVDFGLDSPGIMNMEGEYPEGLKVSCTAGLAQVKIENGANDPLNHDFIGDEDEKGGCTRLSYDNIRERFDQNHPLRVTAIGMNGKVAIVNDLWVRLKGKPYIIIPGSNVALRKQSVRSKDLDSNNDDRDLIQWAMLLHRRGQDGQLHRATSIDLRVGCIMDGAIVYYADGQQANCGPSHPHRFGGHRSESHEIPAEETITKIKICKDDGGWSCLAGICMTLSNGDEWGHLNHIENGSDSDDSHDDNPVFTLEPAEDEVIVGFYGQSSSPSGYTSEFGILTAPRGVKLPENVYNLPEFRNN
ncbi:putative peptidase family-domain-containing protein [Aspergillus caelatus]|uniref:Putative peptidase family-domain-containing protein n=1 Tax=Aspergillus caelatus TaxID=61420 RepID=A0A5N7A1V1_9EURO|nr:putative peptidase family-domain-containing protein [Aspergillus caelatus]KAE8363837.1 putative peptidase family-domain-containing protein [Aspergillus caelatus]